MNMHLTNTQEFFGSLCLGGFFVGVCATIDQHNGLYHFVSTDTASATLWTVELSGTHKATGVASNDYGPEMTSLTWNAADGKLYAVAQVSKVMDGVEFEG